MYREAYERCKMNGDSLPRASAIQELVTVWKQLRNGDGEGRGARISGERHVWLLGLINARPGSEVPGYLCLGLLIAAQTLKIIRFPGVQFSRKLLSDLTRKSFFKSSN